MSNDFAQFQDDVLDLIRRKLKAMGLNGDHIDGKGSDGDEYDFTLAEIAQGFAVIQDFLYDNKLPADLTKLVDIRVPWRPLAGMEEWPKPGVLYRSDSDFWERIGYVDPDDRFSPEEARESGWTHYIPDDEFPW